jgi:hypothetical protein
MIKKRDADVLIACFGKETFTDRHLARKAAARRHGRCAYKCSICGFLACRPQGEAAAVPARQNTQRPAAHALVSKHEATARPR